LFLEILLFFVMEYIVCNVQLLTLLVYYNQDNKYTMCSSASTEEFNLSL